MNGNKTSVFTLMVDNEFGVLTRITALIRRAGWNICSLAVAESEKKELSRLTICLECRHHTLESVLERLGKLNCVRKVSVYEKETQVAQELALMRVTRECSGKFDWLRDRGDVKTLAENGDELLLAITCSPERIESALREVEGAGLIEVARTGTIVMERPKKEGD